MILCDPPYGTTASDWDKVICFKKMWAEYERIAKENAAIVIFAQQPFTSLLICSNIEMYKYNWVWKKNCPSNIANSNRQPMKYHEDICVFYKKQPIYNKQMIDRSESGKKLIKQYQENNTSFKLSASNVSSTTSTEVDPNRYDPNVKNPSTIIEFDINRGKNRFHPTQKPVLLCEYLIKTYTNSNQLV